MRPFHNDGNIVLLIFVHLIDTLQVQRIHDSVIKKCIDSGTALANLFFFLGQLDFHSCLPFAFPALSSTEHLHEPLVFEPIFLRKMISCSFHNSIFCSVLRHKDSNITLNSQIKTHLFMLFRPQTNPRCQARGPTARIMIIEGITSSFLHITSYINYCSSPRSRRCSRCGYRGHP